MRIRSISLDVYVRANGTDKYYFYISEVEGQWSIDRRIDAGTAGAAIIPSLRPGKTYYVTATSRNELGESRKARSNVITIGLKGHVTIR